MTRVRTVVPLVLALAAAVLLGPPASAETIRLGGVRVVLSVGTTQVVTVNHARGHAARVSFWSLGPGGWSRDFTSDKGRTGYGGLVAGAKRHQGSGTTPLGTYGLISAFGTHDAQTGWTLPYRRIASGDFWVEDNASAYYNRYRNQADGGFRWQLSVSRENGSERLTDYPTQYEYAIVTSYNVEQVRHRGAGIFLHVNGRGATAGCVSAPRWFLEAAMARLNPSSNPVIAIGR